MLECFADLDDYGKNQASIVLGQLGALESADLLWEFFERVKYDLDSSHFVGPLWGLVDLGDPRAADALADLLWRAVFCYGIFAMLHRAGDGRAVQPLLWVRARGIDEMREQAGYALCSVAHRLEARPSWNP